MSQRLALFDFDGTLADSGAAILSMYRAAFAQAGLESPPDDTIRATIGLPLRHAIAGLFPHLDAPEVERVAGLYAAEYRRRHAPGQPAPAALFDGALEAMAEMEQTMLLGIATGKSRRGLEQALASLGLESRFIVKLTADDGPAKPHPAIVHEAMALTGVEAASTLVIGDTVYDIEMAKAAGVAAVGVTWGHHAAEDLSRAGADRLIDSFQQLPGLALTLTGN